MEITLILSIVFGSLSVLTTILSIIFDNSKTKQDKMKEIFSKIPEFITEIETHVGAGNGKLKKRLCMSDVRDECLKLGLKWTETNAQLFDDYIESVLTSPQKKIKTDVKENEQNGTTD